MSGYSVAVSIHVLFAVIGTGLLGAIPLLARAARTSHTPLSVLETTLRPVFLFTQIALGLTFLSGAVMDFLTHGALHDQGWFRLGALAIVVAGIARARAKTLLKRGGASKPDPQPVIRGIEGWGAVACFAIAAATVVMELKPF